MTITDTTNYKLKKPDKTERFNIDTFNANSDAIDAGLEKRSRVGTTTPTFATGDHKGDRYYDTVAKKEYFCDGTVWIAMESGKTYLDGDGVTIGTDNKLNADWSKVAKKSDLDTKQSKLTYGAADPAGGSDGDVYIKDGTTHYSLWQNRSGTWTKTVDPLSIIDDTSTDSATRTWSVAKIKPLLDALTGIVTIEVVATEPTDPVANTMYYIGTSAPYTIKLCIEDASHTKTMVEMGTTDVDLTNYYKKTETYSKTETDTLLLTKQNNVIYGTTEPDASMGVNGDVYIKKGGTSSSCPFPVGAVFISVGNANPSSYWSGTTWSKLSDGTMLMADSTGGKTAVAANLPKPTFENAGSHTHTFTGTKSQSTSEQAAHSHGVGSYVVEGKVLGLRGGSTAGYCAFGTLNVSGAFASEDSTSDYCVVKEYSKGGNDTLVLNGYDGHGFKGSSAESGKHSHTITPSGSNADAGEHTHSVKTAGVYTDTNKVIPSGTIKVVMWERTA